MKKATRFLQLAVIALSLAFASVAAAQQSKYTSAVFGNIPCVKNGSVPGVTTIEEMRAHLEGLGYRKEYIKGNDPRMGAAYLQGWFEHTPNTYIKEFTISEGWYYVDADGNICYLHDCCNRLAPVPQDQIEKRQQQTQRNQEQQQEQGQTYSNQRELRSIPSFDRGNNSGGQMQQQQQQILVIQQQARERQLRERQPRQYRERNFRPHRQPRESCLTTARPRPPSGPRYCAPKVKTPRPRRDLSFCAPGSRPLAKVQYPGLTSNHATYGKGGAKIGTVGTRNGGNTFRPSRTISTHRSAPRTRAPHHARG